MLTELRRAWVSLPRLLVRAGHSTSSTPQPPRLCCSSVFCQANRLADETVVNGAQIVYSIQFGIEENERYKGLTNGAPYLACAVLGCWLTVPLNAMLGRRGVIFFGALLSIVACIWQACVNSWWHLVISRLVLGLAIGPMSATVPMYASETAPSIIR